MSDHEQQSHILDVRELSQTAALASGNVSSLPEVSNSRERLLALLGAVSLTGLVVAFSLLPLRQPTQPAPLQVATAVAPINELHLPPAEPNPFSEVRVNARAAIVYDIEAKQVLFGKHEREALPLASLTKLMTYAAAAEVLDAEELVEITQNALDTDGDSGLFVGEQWRFEDLAAFSLMTSSNDGSEAIGIAAGTALLAPNVVEGEYDAVEAFVSQMNAQADVYAMKETTFVNTTGLDEPDGRVSRGSVYDIALLLAALAKQNRTALHSTAQAETEFISESNQRHTAVNTNPHVERLTGTKISKTGFTDAAGGNLALLIDTGMNNHIAIVVLGSTREDRFRDVETLLTTYYAYTETEWDEYDRIK